MGVVIVDGSTIRNFDSVDAAFRRLVDECFTSFDVDRDGVLSRSGLRDGLESFRLAETHFGINAITPPDQAITPPDQVGSLYDSIFEQFNVDRNGTVDLEEFRSEMRRIMLVVADGLGTAPIQMAVEEGEDSFLKKVTDGLGTAPIQMAVEEGEDSSLKKVAEAAKSAAASSH